MPLNPTAVGNYAKWIPMKWDVIFNNRGTKIQNKLNMGG